MIKDLLDKKFTKANVVLHDMLKNKAFDAITDFKNNFKYVTTKAAEVKKEDTTMDEGDVGAKHSAAMTDLSNKLDQEKVKAKIRKQQSLNKKKKKKEK